MTRSAVSSVVLPKAPKFQYMHSRNARPTLYYCSKALSCKEEDLHFTPAGIAPPKNPAATPERRQQTGPAHDEATPGASETSPARGSG